ncbi:hypothetical protein [Streptomyces longisporoflavus]|nr:hypothetical protein [Streptomyces longisporoflavus]
MNERYWVDAQEAERRRETLDAQYAAVGVTDRGRTVAIDVAAAL